MAVQSCVGFRGDPSAMVVALTLLVPLDVCSGEPSELLVPNLAVAEPVDLEPRAPIAAVLLIAQDTADRLVVRVFPQGRQQQVDGQRGLMGNHRPTRKHEQRVGLIVLQTHKPTVPLRHGGRGVGRWLGGADCPREHHHVELVRTAPAQPRAGLLGLLGQPLPIAPVGQLGQPTGVVVGQLLGRLGQVLRLGRRAVQRQHAPHGRNQDAACPTESRDGCSPWFHSLSPSRSDPAPGFTVAIPFPLPLVYPGERKKGRFPRKPESLRAETGWSGGLAGRRRSGHNAGTVALSVVLAC